MLLSLRLRKFALIVHVTASVGWIGAVIAYLALVVAAMTNQKVQTLCAARIALEFIGRFAIVPLSLVSLLTGLVMALGTKWGLLDTIGSCSHSRSPSLLTSSCLNISRP